MFELDFPWFERTFGTIIDNRPLLKICSTKSKASLIGVIMPQDRCLVGRFAPDFSSPAAFPGEAIAATIRTLSLSDYKGRWLTFFWYPLDFTFVCPSEILAMSDRLDEFRELDCEVLGASTDSVFSHRVWMTTSRAQNGIEDIRFPLLADKTHEIARRYEVLVEEEGVALRGLFIIDPEGVIQYSVVHNLNTGRSVDETVRVLAAIQTGELCGSDWEPGDQTLQSSNERPA